MSIRTNKFDIAEHLETEEDIFEFLRESLATGSDSDFIHTLNIAARAKGMTEVAKKAGVSRASLYKSLSGSVTPSFSTVRKVMDVFGLGFSLSHKSEGANTGRHFRH